MGQPGYGQGSPQQPGQPQQPAWGGETQQQQPAWGSETQQQPQPQHQPGDYGAPAPGFGAAPASGGGYGAAPASGGGYGAAQTSGPAFGAPAQGPSHTMPMPQMSQPDSAPPFGAPPPAGPPSPKKGPWVPVLAGTTALFLIISVVFLGLWISTGNDLDKANQTISKQKDTISARDKTISDNKETIDDRDDKIKSLQGDLKKSKKNSKDLADEKATIAKCLRLVAAWIQASREGDEEKTKRAAKALQKPCEEADKVM